MKALTLRQPWATAVSHWGKRVENRTRCPPASLLGERIAIHSGLWWRPEEVAETVAEIDSLGLVMHVPGPITLRQLMAVRGSIVATARLAGFRDAVRAPGPWWPARCAGADDRTAAALHAITTDPWWVGPVGWLLDDVHALAEPVPCSGAQGLWTLPADVELKVAS